MSTENGERPTKKAKVEEAAIEVEKGAKDSVGFKFKYTPKKDLTGVDESITRLSAAMSGQLYCVQKQDDFDLSTPTLQVETVFFDDHGKLKVLSPFFAGAVSVADSTMVIGWRGTTDDIMNVITDLNATPATSSRWGGISTDIKVHGGFQSIAENDLCSWESKIIELMDKHQITQLITTGHSLGGGIATVAHLAIEGELHKDKSLWKDYAEKLKSQGKEFTVRCVAFSAPSSIYNLDKPDNAVVNDFLKKIEANSCNVIYATDPVPRLPGYLKFIDTLAKELIPEVTEDIIDKFGFLGRVGSNYLDLAKGYENLIASQGDLVEAVINSRHIAKIIYYKDDVSVPLQLKDYGATELGSPDGIKNFRDIQWEETPDVMGCIMHNHNITVRGPGLGYNILEEKTEAKLYFMHNRSMMEDEPDVAKVPVDGWEDCRKKAKEHFVYAFMGGYVDWEDEPKDKEPHERKGVLHVKQNVAKEAEDAEWVKNRGWFGGEVKHTALWRTPALADKVKQLEEA